ncbi:MAG: KpsF/GutQ family sugar-phosphate isomerase [Bacteroidota bacterium]
MTDKKIIESARRTLTIEADAVSKLSKYLNQDFIRTVKKIFSSKGRVVVTGIGKSAIIAQKIVATFNSTGTAALYMHAADAIHGDLGMIQKDDTIICISKSGESAEIKVLIPLIKHSGNFLIGMVGNEKSFLAKNADSILNTTIEQEACSNNLAPTTSTTAQMAMGDALAVCLQEMRGFNSKDFARIHPGGALGKQLYLKVKDLAALHTKPVVKENDSISKVIVAMTGGRLGATAVLDKKGKLKGIITDGDLRRMIEKNADYNKLIAMEVMSKNPKIIQMEELAVNALQLMRECNITQIIVMNKTQYAGMMHVHDLLREGLL